jgi:3-hydroxyisobutyrate dehydrogenase-like beta-hydroxyacid dehydrogenase
LIPVASQPVPVLGFIGFGEAGSRIASGLREAGVRGMAAYDTADNERIRQRAKKADVALVNSNAELAARCSIVISVVTASSALDAARQSLPHLLASHVYIDCNSVSPARKREIAQEIEAGPARFIEAAIMAPVPKRKGQSVPMLINGSGAAELAESLAAFGFDMEALNAPFGTAAAVKMCRSIVVKGLEAILTECLLGASRFDAEERVFVSLQQSFPGIDWKRLADYMVNRLAVHGERRAREMEEVAETLRSVGIEPIMAEATARRQDWSAQLGLASRFGPEGPATYRDVLQALPEALAEKERLGSKT